MAKIETQYVLVGRDRTQQATRSFRRNIASIRQSVVGLQGLLVGGFAVAAVKSITKAAISLEQIQRGLKAATGSSKDAAEEFQFLRKESERLGLNLESAGTAYTKLAAAAKGTVLEGKEARNIFVAISEASRVMGLSAEQTGGALTAIEQIISKGKVSAEELRGQLGERLPGAFQIAARSIGKTTEELDAMLKAGKLTAEELLPSLADELRKTFSSEIDEAANDAQAAFNRFGTAVFELKAAFAQSGLLDILENSARFLTGIANAAGDALNVTLKESAEELRAQIRQLVDQRDLVPTADTGTRQLLNDQILQLQNMLDLTNNRLQLEERIAEQRERDLAVQQSLVRELDASRFAETDRTSQFFTDDDAKRFQTFIGQFETADQKVGNLRDTFNEFKTLIDTVYGPEEVARINKAITDMFLIDEITVEPMKRSVEFFKKGTDQMTEFARQASRNIQDAFADFLFEPFEDGLDGMVRSFVDALRRMLANQAASQFASFVTGLFGGSAISGISPSAFAPTPRTYFPGRAAGGPVSANSPYIVGERGRELFVPNQNGAIIPNNQLGGNVTVQNDITVESGASFAEFEALLPEISRRIERNTIDSVSRLMKHGQLV